VTAEHAFESNSVAYVARVHVSVRPIRANSEEREVHDDVARTRPDGRATEDKGTGIRWETKGVGGGVLSSCAHKFLHTYACPFVPSHEPTDDTATADATAATDAYAANHQEWTASARYSRVTTQSTLVVVADTVTNRAS
jgi:hypothetical protein